GALPQANIRKFRDKHVASAEETAAGEERQEAEELLAEGDTDSALERLQEAVAINPNNDAARYDYLRALLMSGRIDDAKRAYEPVAAKVIPDARLTACGLWIAACEAAREARSHEVLE